MIVCNTCHLEYKKVSRCEVCKKVTCYGCLFVSDITKKFYLCKGCMTDNDTLLEVENAKERNLFNINDVNSNVI